MRISEKVELIVQRTAEISELEKEMSEELGVRCFVLSDGDVSVDCVPVGVMGKRIESEDGAFYAYEWEKDGVHLVHYTKREGVK